MTKLTMKNTQVFRFYQERSGGHKNYKTVFDENKAEIEQLFGIKTYAGFRQHCAKVFAVKQLKGNNND